MKSTETPPLKISKPRIKKTSSPKPEKPVPKKMEDIQRLVHLLQVHQIELEHQNQELRIAQEELEASRNKYVAFFDFSPIPYFTLDAEGMIKEVNLSASNMFGIARGKLIGKRFQSYITLYEKDIFDVFIQTLFTTHEKQTCELNITNKDKSVFHVHMEGLEIEDTLEPELKCQVALIDLTEYKKIENSLKDSNEELNALNITKDKFFSIIAHDLRSPFQSLLGSSEMLATEIKGLSQEEIVSLGKGLNDSLKNLYALLENLLYWSMMQRNIVEYNPTQINLFDLVQKIFGLTDLSIKKKNIVLINKIENGTFVYADVDMLRLILHNLLMNAIKFTPAEGGKITLSSTDEGGFVEVSVQDTGVGIEFLNSSGLFNFNTITTTKGTAGEKGTGLGLPLCKEFVERCGGTIWVESDLGKGSRFTFTLQKKH